ncbi:GNAT family N-acetyltransferase [Herbihabitans rhizosphaerae]|uniref:GNAT family N-acetyltransferase n=1 Tax=Herbihabitans rhizosphaerae TaxID=1872711 RepID=UPI0013EE8CB8|nr:GNAT family N-acetyltransferase [Herbihabitans rhizosphaerae]
MEPVTLRTERPELRPFTPDDADAVYLACQDPDIQRFTPMGKPFLRVDAERARGRDRRRSPPWPAPCI